MFKYLFGTDPEKLTENVIITPFFSPKRFKDHCEIVSEFKGGLYSGAFCRAEGKEFTLIRCGIGAGIAGDCVIGFKGTKVKDIIFAGSAGGLNTSEIGDIIISEFAYAGEGFSAYHDDRGIHNILDNSNVIAASPVFSGAIEEKIKETQGAGDILRKGKVFTIGSLMAETEDLLEVLEKKGFLGVEMELSAVFQAALKLKKNIAGILFVRDLPLIKPFWKEMEKEDNNNYNYSVDLVIRTCVEVFTH